MVSSDPVVIGAVCDTIFSIHYGGTSQTISGNSDVNAGFNYPYSVPYISGSSWLWIAPTESISQNANNANLNWNIIGQFQLLKVYETNQYGCLGDVSTKKVNVYPLKITNVNPSTLSPCPGTLLSISANAYGVYYPGNIFTAQLSDGSGSFASPVVIGSYSPSTQPFGNAQPITINAMIPGTTPGGSNYRVRITGSHYPVTSDTSNSILIARPIASFSINSNSSQCHGGNNFIFTNLSAVSGGTMTYQWYFGDNTTSTNTNPSHTYISVGNYTFKLVATSNNGCIDSISANVRVLNCGTYTFIGNGDWNTASNWLNNLVPPTTIVNNMSVTINPAGAGQCYYIGTIYIQSGGVITVVSGKAFNVRLQ